MCFCAAALALALVGCSGQNPLTTTHVNQEASLGGALPSGPLQGQVITSWIDSRDGTMSTLLGNDVAVRYARTNSGHAYPAGAALTLATWTQAEDGRWFGARIPAAAKSVEFVTIGLDANHQAAYSYQKYEGAPLRRVSAMELGAADERISFLISQRAAVMP